jgi:hypothetical protein
MPRKRTPSFILELPLRTSPADERACAIMLDAARNIGDAVLGEGLRRLDLMRESKAYQPARKMSRGEPRSPARNARATEFKRLFEAFGFTGHGLQKFAQACRDNCWIKDHLPGERHRTDLNLREWRGFAFPHVTLGVRAGRSNNGAKCTRDAGNAVAVAHWAAARVSESSAAGTEAPRFSEG